MELVAAIRPDDWSFVLFLHVLGSMVMVGSLVLALIYLAGAWRGESADSLRLGFRVLLYGALPSFIVMRVAAQWIWAQERLDDLPDDPAWIGLGFSIADGGLLLLLVATIVSGVASRRAETAEAADAQPGGAGSVRVTTALVSLLLIAYVAAIWAMTTKPV